LSSNTNIGNTPVNQGYVQLVHMGETGGIDGTLRTLYDGDGTASDLQIASNKVKISTELYIGSKTIAEYVQDVVGDMFDTNGSHTNITATYDDAGDGAIDLNASGDVTLSNTVTLSNKTLAAPILTGTTQGASITLSGDLTVNGTTTTVNQTNLDVSDNIIGLNRGASSNANDSGLIIERGSTGNNVFIGWDESLDRIRFATTTADASSTGNLSLTNANIHAGRLYADVTGDVTGNADTSTKIASITNSDIVQLTDTQTLTNKTLASPTFTGDIDFSDANTPQLNITDTTNTITTRVASSNTIGSVGTVTAHNLNIVRNNVGHFQLYANYTMHNQSGNDIDFRAKDSSGNIVFKVDAGTSKTEIGTLSVTGNATVTGDITGDVTGDLTGNADTATALATARSITMSGEVSSGAVNFDGTAGVVIPNTTIGSGVIEDGSIASDAAIATSKLASNTISGVALGSNLNALTVGTGMAFASGSNYTGATARQINLNLSAIDHDSLGNYVEEEHIDWTIDQGATNIHAGNYTDTNTNQLTTFTATDGGSQSVTIAQGKYWKFKNGAGVDVEFTDFNGGGSGDPFDLTFKLDLSTVGALADTLESGDNLLVYNADEGTALAPISEIQSALSIPSASGTTDGVLTLNANGTLTGESGLTYDTSTLAVTGDLNITGYVYDSDSGNRLTLDDDTDSAQANQVTLAGANNVNILIDGTNNGTGDFQIRSRPTTANDLDTADIIVDIDETTAIFDNITSQQFRINGASRTTINESGLKVEQGSLGVGQTPPSVNGHAHISNLLRVGTNGEVALTVNDGGGNANVTFNHTSKVPDRDGNSGRIEVNVDSSGGQYMAFELAGNVTSGVSVATTEIARINSTGLQSSLSGTAASPALRVNDTDTGLYRIADNKLGISTAGTFAVAVDASQNVGIGTTSPSEKLDIRDGELVFTHSSLNQALSGRIRFNEYNGDDESGAYIQYNGASNYLQMFTNTESNDYEFLRALRGSHLALQPSGGNVGIGTESPNTLLHLYSTGNTQMRLQTNSASSASSIVYQNGTASYSVGINAAEQFSFYSSQLGSDALVINGNGNVGIGGSPEGNAKLDIKMSGVSQYLKLERSSSSGRSQIQLANESGTELWRFGLTGGGSEDFSFWDGSFNHLVFDRSANSAQFGGSVGINVTPSGTSGRLDCSNDVVAYSTSDKRLKENIKPLDSALDKVLKISGVSFDWKELTKEEKKTIHGNEGHDVGVIAQEIEEVLPEVVTERDTGYKAVKYEKIVPLLIEAIKEQQKQIEELKNG